MSSDFLGVINSENNLFIYQLCTNGTQVPCEVPSLLNPTTRKDWPQHRGLRPLLFSSSYVGFFCVPQEQISLVLWYGTHGFSSLSLTTRKSNHLQMSLQRQHFLLSYLKTLSVPETKSRVCITVSNSPNASSVYIMLCKHRKKVFYCFYKINFTRKNAKLFVRHWLEETVAKSCLRSLARVISPCFAKRCFPKYGIFLLKMSA